MTDNEAETRFWLIDPVLHGKGFDAHWKLKLETPAAVAPVSAALTICCACSRQACPSRYRSA